MLNFDVLFKFFFDGVLKNWFCWEVLDVERLVKDVVMYIEVWDKRFWGVLNILYYCNCIVMYNLYVSVNFYDNLCNKFFEVEKNKCKKIYKLFIFIFIFNKNFIFMYLFLN